MPWPKVGLYPQLLGDSHQSIGMYVATRKDSISSIPCFDHGTYTHEIPILLVYSNVLQYQMNLASKEKTGRCGKLWSQFRCQGISVALGWRRGVEMYDFIPKRWQIVNHGMEELMAIRGMWHPMKMNNYHLGKTFATRVRLVMVYRWVYDIRIQGD